MDLNLIKGLGSEFMQTDKRIVLVDILFIVLSLYIALLLKFDFNITRNYMVFFFNYQ